VVSIKELWGGYTIEGRQTDRQTDRTIRQTDRQTDRTIGPGFLTT